MAGVKLKDRIAEVEEHKKCWMKCNTGRSDRAEMTCGHYENAKGLVDRGEADIALCPKFAYIKRRTGEVKQYPRETWCEDLLKDIGKEEEPVAKQLAEIDAEFERRVKAGESKANVLKNCAQKRAEVLASIGIYPGP